VACISKIPAAQEQTRILFAVPFQGAYLQPAMLFQGFPPRKLTPAESFCFATAATGAVVFAISFTCR
jgi:hypothetical protein